MTVIIARIRGTAWGSVGMTGRLLSVKRRDHATAKPMAFYRGRLLFS